MAGFFGLFNYSKPGRGVYKNEPKHSRFVQFWILTQRKFWRICHLNLIYILFCLPVVTIGPATAGMTYVLRQFANEQPVFLFSDFWDTFRSNFKQSFAFSVIQVLFAVIMGTSMQFYYLNAPQHGWMYFTMGLCLMVTLLFIMASFYVYLMIVTLELPLRAIIKNAFIFSILNLKTNLLTLLFVALPTALTALFFPVTVILMIFVLFAFCSFIICYNSYPAIKKYAIDPYMESLREQAAQKDEANDGDGSWDDEEGGSIFSDEMKLPGGME